MENALYIFIDESGNLDFSANGSKYYVFTATTTRKPLRNRFLLHKLRYQLLYDGIDLEYFHATEDLQDVRNSFFSIIKHYGDFQIDSVIAQKNKVHSSLYKETYQKRRKWITRTTGDEFYRINCQTLLQFIFRRYRYSNLDRIVVVLSSIFTKQRRSAIIKALKIYLKTHTNTPFSIYFHDGKADINCQIADYCCWAMAVKWERSELRPFEEIKDKVRSEFDIFRNGTTIHYPYNE